jgi:hypothetical protein
MKMWSVQQQEEYDYQMGAASDAENALAWNRMNMKPDDSGKIAEAVAAGKFVVVLEGTAYCPSTDAIMGSRKFLHSAHDTRAEAQAAILAMDDMDDISVYVRPSPKSPVIPYVPSTNDDIPF